jgi:hypothetical protein
MYIYIFLNFRKLIHYIFGITNLEKEKEKKKALIMMQLGKCFGMGFFSLFF